MQISARLRMHEDSAYEPRPHLFTAVIIIWRRRRRQIGDSALASLPFFEDSRQICVLRDLYGVHGDTQACAWSRALTTAWSRAYCAFTIITSTFIKYWGRA